MTRDSILPLLTVLIPAACACAALLVPAKRKRALAIAGVAGAGLNLLFALLGFTGRYGFERAWAYWEMDFSLKTSPLSGAVLSTLAALALFLAILALLKPERATKPVTALSLLTLALANGAVLADNLVAMLFFWQALWLPVYAMILLGGGESFRTSFKALATLAVTDLSLMFGVGLAGYLSHTMAISGTEVPSGPMAATALTLMALGALGKLGVYPFHGWRYRALSEAPAALLALIPGATDLLLGGYLLIRLNGLFPFAGDAYVSYLAAALGILSMLLSILGLAKRRSPSDVAAFGAGAMAALWLFGNGALLLGFAIASAAASCVAHAYLPRAQVGPRFDPYPAAESGVRIFARAALKVNDFISRIYDAFIPKVVDLLSLAVRRAHNGSQARYVVWVIAGAAIVALIYRLS